MPPSADDHGVGAAPVREYVLTSDIQLSRLSDICRILRKDGDFILSIIQHGHTRLRWGRPADEDLSIIRRSLQFRETIPESIPGSITLEAAQVDVLVSLGDILIHLCNRHTKQGAQMLRNGLDLVILIAQLVLDIEDYDLSRFVSYFSELATVVELLHRQFRSWPFKDQYEKLFGLAHQVAQHDHLRAPLTVPLLRMRSRLHEMRYQREKGDQSCSIADLSQAMQLLQDLLAEETRLTITDNNTPNLEHDIAALASELGDTQAFDTCLQFSLDNIPNPISLAHLPSFRFRFIHCRSFLDHGQLRIVSFESLPEGRYCAISYVWKGLACLKPGENQAPSPVLEVQGAEDADPISLDVLRSVCLAALHMRCELLWLDRLSMIQEKAEDKAWQIQNMARIYGSCRMCCILPGGLMRLAAIDEETDWIHRGWTLQEAAAPQFPYVLVYWPWGTTHEVTSGSGQAYFHEIESGKSAISSLAGILPCAGDALAWPARVSKQKVVCNLFGQSFDIAATALGGSLHTDHEDVERQTERATFIWRSSLLRTSSRPVDMVFSIMGLLGVTLDVSSYASHERERATADLAQALVAKGERLYWLGLFLGLPPNLYNSYLPILPETTVARMAHTQTPEGFKAVTDLMPRCPLWFIPDAPNAVLDPDGYIEFEARVAPVCEVIASTDTSTEQGSLVIEQNMDSMSSKRRTWCVQKDLQDTENVRDGWPAHCCVVIGSTRCVKNAFLSRGATYPDSHRAVIIARRQREDSYECIGYGLVSMTWSSFNDGGRTSGRMISETDHWKLKKIKIGGGVKSPVSGLEKAKAMA